MSKADGVQLDLETTTQYRSLVGTLQYCCIIRTKLASTINKLCQFMSSPTDKHCQAIKRTLRYFFGECESWTIVLKFLKFGHVGIF